MSTLYSYNEIFYKFLNLYDKWYAFLNLLKTEKKYFTYLTKSHKHLLDNFKSVKALTSSFERITKKCCKNLNLSGYKILRRHKLNNGKKADVSEVFFHADW